MCPKYYDCSLYCRVEVLDANIAQFTWCVLVSYLQVYLRLWVWLSVGVTCTVELSVSASDR